MAQMIDGSNWGLGLTLVGGVTREVLCDGKPGRAVPQSRCALECLHLPSDIQSLPFWLFKGGFQSQFRHCLMV